MKITRTSIVTNVTRTREIDITPEQVLSWVAGTAIQNAAPHLDEDDREFVITGIVPEEWVAFVVPQDD